MKVNCAAGCPNAELISLVYCDLWLVSAICVLNSVGIPWGAALTSCYIDNRCQVGNSRMTFSHKSAMQKKYNAATLPEYPRLRYFEDRSLCNADSGFTIQW